MDVELVDRQPCRLAVVRHVGAYFAIGDAFATLGQRAGAAGLIGPDSEMIAVFHDDPDTVPVADLQSDAGFSVRDDAVLPDGLGELRLAGGKYARAVHVGPYERLADSWSQLMGEWLPESGHRIGAGGTFEKYLNTPMDTPIDQLRTEIYISLE
ncbi:MAG: GyrI-like domain-containing protein [Acidobacteria bacterium]|nr:GyrI-like domain-containing protein [Acidobacteriota bacterium]